MDIGALSNGASAEPAFEPLVLSTSFILQNQRAGNGASLFGGRRGTMPLDMFT